MKATDRIDRAAVLRLLYREWQTPCLTTVSAVGRVIRQVDTLPAADAPNLLARVLDLGVSCPDPPDGAEPIQCVLVTCSSPDGRWHQRACYTHRWYSYCENLRELVRWLPCGVAAVLSRSRAHHALGVLFGVHTPQATAVQSQSPAASEAKG